MENGNWLKPRDDVELAALFAKASAYETRGALGPELALQPMRGEQVPQRMQSDPAGEPRGLGRHLTDPVELAHRDWPKRILAREQPGF
jgi:hypothetical protein